MASKESSLRSEVQREIKMQGEIIRQLKLEEQTDEVKNKVSVSGFPFNVLWISSIKPVCMNTWALCSPPLAITEIKSFLPYFKKT